MLNVVWIIMIGGSLIYALFTNNIYNASNALLKGAEDAVQLCLTLAAIYSLWLGLLKILEESSFVNGLIKLLSKPLSYLFPKSFKNKKTAEAISLNISANMLGLGNAATPSGIKAVSLMSNGSKANDEVIMLLVVNSTSIQLIPATIISMRAAFNSSSPSDIIIPVLISTIVSATVGIILCKICARFKGRKNAANN